MNQTYKSLWNVSTGTTVAVPETAMAAGQQVISTRGARRALARVQTQRLALEPRIVFDGALPVAVTDNYSMPEDGTIGLTPLAGDSDPEGDALTVTGINGTTLTPGIAQIINVPNGTVNVSALGAITFAPTLNYVGTSTFAYTISDGTGGASANQNITVTAVNDAPLNTVPLAQTTLEDTVIVFSSANSNAIQISDVDAGTSPVTVTIWAENGLLTLSGTAGLTFSTNTFNTAVSTGTNDATIRMTGTVANINAALNGLSFAPTANNNGAGRIIIRTEDNGNTGTGGNLMDTDSVIIDFIPVQDTVADVVVTNEDTPIVISPLLNDTFGTGNAFLTSVSSPSNGMAVLNPGTGTTTYTPSTDFNGTDSYSYTVTTIDHGFNYEYYNINPSESGSYGGVFPSGFPTTPANGTGWTAGISVPDGHRIQEQQNDNDPTLIARWSGVVLIEQSGNYTFNIAVDNAARLIVDGVVVIADANYQVTSVKTATVALTAGVHTFQLHYGELNANDAISMTYSGLDTGGAVVNVNNDKHWGSAARTETETIAITVNPVNDVPVNTVPVAQTTLEDTAIVFSTANGNAIQISDVDTGAGMMTVTLWAENGTITLVQTTGLTFSTHFVDNPAGTMDTAASSGSNDATIRFSGSIADINAALNGLSFSPTANNNGAGRITIRTEDNGNTGIGGNLADTDSVNVDFIPVKDTAIDNVVTNEDTSVVISPLANDMFGAGNAFLTGVGTPGNGTAVLNLGTGTTTYTPNTNFNGSDSYTYTSTTIDPGFNYEYYTANQDNNGTYDGTFASGFPTTTADATGWTETISGDDSARIQEHQNDADNETTIRWSGVVLIEQAGTYTFSLNADNAARLLIDGNPVVTVGWIDDTLIGAVALSAGVHTFQLEYADADIQQVVTLSYAGLDTGGAVVNVNNDKHWGSAARTETDTILITVNPINDAPVAVDDGTLVSPIVIAEDTPSTLLHLLSNDTDVDGDTLSIQSINGTAIVAGTAYSIPVPNGTVNVATTGEISFTPAPNYNGPVTLDYVVQDPSGETDTGTVNLSIVVVNDPPVATPVSATGTEDTPLAVVLTGTDIDGTVASITVSNLPPASQGVLTKADGTPVVAGVPLTPAEAAGLAFVPAPNFNGTVNPITFTVTDNGGSISSPATASLTVVAVNDPPVAIGGSANTLEDTNVSISLAGTDVDGTVTGVTVTTLPLVTEGIITLADGTPITAGQLLTPVQAASLIFVPALNFNGVVNISFTVTDNSGAVSAPANFTIDVADVDDDPVATPQALSTPEDTPIAVSLTGTDVEGPITAVTVTSLPPASQGILTKSDGTPVVAGVPLTPAEAAGLRFNPAPNFNGPVNISFTVTDSVGQVSSPPAALTLSVTPVNDAPVAVDESIVVNEDSLNNPSIASLLANDMDVDGPAFILSTVGTFTTTAGGTITIAADGTYTYTPLAGYIGPDSFSYTVTDSSLTDTGMLNITVAPVNDAPVAADDSISVNEDSINNPSIASLLANDTDIDGPTLSIAPSSIGTFTTAAGGTITMMANGSYTYTPLAGYVGPDSFNYIVTDGSLTDTGTLNIMVNPVNDAPIAVNDAAATPEDTSIVLNLLGNDTDVEGDGLSLNSINGTPITLGAAQTIAVPNGTVTVSATGVVMFTPAPNYNGLSVFTYDIKDTSSAVSTLASASVMVGSVDDTPIAVTDNYNMSEGGSAITLTPLTGDSDPDGTNPTIQSINSVSLTGGVQSIPVTGGIVNISAGGVMTFSPSANFNGTVTFPYVITDGTLTATANQVITVAAVNDSPVAVDDVVTTNHGTPVVLDIIGNDTDVDGDVLTLSSINGTLITPGTAQTITVPNGTVNVSAAGVITFTPAPNYTGSAQFNYVVQDPSGATDAGMVTIQVSPANAPVVSGPVVDTVLFEQLLPQPMHFGDEHYPGEYALQTHGLPLGMPEDIFVTHSVRESQNQVAKNSTLGVFNADTPTANELSHYTNSLNGLPVGMDTNLYVQHAVRGIPVTTEHNLYVQHAVRQSQLESVVRNIGVNSFNSASAGVASVLSPFELGAPHAAIDLAVDGVQGEFTKQADSKADNVALSDIEKERFSHTHTDTVTQAPDTQTVVHKPLAAASFSHQLSLAAKKLKANGRAL